MTGAAVVVNRTPRLNLVLPEARSEHDLQYLPWAALIEQFATCGLHVCTVRRRVPVDRRRRPARRGLHVGSEPELTAYVVRRRAACAGARLHHIYRCGAGLRRGLQLKFGVGRSPTRSHRIPGPGIDIIGPATVSGHN